MSLTALRDLLEDERVWCVAATVQLHEGESEHFARASNGQIMVSVITNQHAVPIWAQLRGGDFSRRGVWTIPAIGTEVILNFDNGEFEGDPYIIGVIGRAPEDLDGEVTLIIDNKVKIRSLDGTAAPLPTMDDFNALKNYVENHTHTYAPGPGAPVQTTPPSVPGGAPDPAPTPNGTQVLEVE